RSTTSASTPALAQAPSRFPRRVLSTHTSRASITSGSAVSTTSSSITTPPSEKKNRSTVAQLSPRHTCTSPAMPPSYGPRTRHTGVAPVAQRSELWLSRTPFDVSPVSVTVPEAGPPARSLPTPPSLLASNSTDIPFTMVDANTRHTSSPQSTPWARRGGSGRTGSGVVDPHTAAATCAAMVTTHASTTVATTTRGGDARTTATSFLLPARLARA